MKPKSYWHSVEARTDPFRLPKAITKGISETARKFSEDDPNAKKVKYIWLHVTDNGVHSNSGDDGPDASMALDDWLNVVDESVALGAEWLVVFAGISLSQSPQTWKLCHWAQETHQLSVGIYITTSSLSEDDIEHLGRLDPEKTFLVADKAEMASLKTLERLGIRVCKANVERDERMVHCKSPEAIACVNQDGAMYTCGLVLGNESYRLGNYRQRPLDHIMTDDSTRHDITNTEEFSEFGCDGCPTHVVTRFEEAAQD